MRAMMCVALVALTPTLAAGPPSERASLLERIREIHRQVVSAQALAETPLDETARRSLLKRLEKAELGLAELELAVRAEQPQVSVPVPAMVPAPTVAPRPLGDAEVSDLVRQLGRASFAADRKAVLEAALDHRTVTTVQARRLLDVFTFSTERIDAAAFVVPRLSDLDRAHTLLDAMDFTGDKEALRELIRAARAR